MNTPPQGHLIVNLISEVKKDLSSHIQKDERDTAYIRQAQDTQSRELAAQSRELGVQTAMLSELLEQRKIARELDQKRATTAIELKSKTWGWLIKAIIGVLAAGATAVLGAYIHSRWG